MILKDMSNTKKLTQSQLSDLAKDTIVATEIFLNQTSLVSECLSKDILSYDDMLNIYSYVLTSAKHYVYDNVKHKLYEILDDGTLKLLYNFDELVCGLLESKLEDLDGDYTVTVNETCPYLEKFYPGLAASLDFEGWQHIEDLSIFQKLVLLDTDHFCDIIRNLGINKDNICEFSDFDEGDYSLNNDFDFEGFTLEFGELPEYEEQQNEVYQWFAVSEWLYKKLEEAGEIVISLDDFNYWWGCGTYRQSICMDAVILKITAELNNVEII